VGTRLAARRGRVARRGQVHPTKILKMRKDRKRAMHQQRARIKKMLGVRFVRGVLFRGARFSPIYFYGVVDF